MEIYILWKSFYKSEKLIIFKYQLRLLSFSNAHNRRTTWHVDLPPPVDTNSDMMTGDTETTDSDSVRTSYDTASLEGFTLISTAAKRVWEDLYVAKKPVSSREKSLY